MRTSAERKNTLNFDDLPLSNGYVSLDAAVPISCTGANGRAQVACVYADAVRDAGKWPVFGWKVDTDAPMMTMGKVAFAGSVGNRMFSNEKKNM